MLNRTINTNVSVFASSYDTIIYGKKQVVKVSYNTNYRITTSFSKMVTSQEVRGISIIYVIEKLNTPVETPLPEKKGRSSIRSQLKLSER